MKACKIHQKNWCNIPHLIRIAWLGEYSEDNLIEQTAIDLFSIKLGWIRYWPYNKEGYGETALWGDWTKKVVLKKIFLKSWKQFPTYEQTTNQA